MNSIPTIAHDFICTRNPSHQNRSQTPAVLLPSAYRRLTIQSWKSVRSQASSLTSYIPTHPLQRCQPCARPHSAGSVPPAPPLTSPQAPSKRKTDDCTPLQSSAPLISSVPLRHQTCRAESFFVTSITIAARRPSLVACTSDWSTV